MNEIIKKESPWLGSENCLPNGDTKKMILFITFITF